MIDSLKTTTKDVSTVGYQVWWGHFSKALLDWYMLKEIEMHENPCKDRDKFGNYDHKIMIECERCDDGW